ncbi:TPA: helix-turn-helix domain-containing protein [Vibrio harveyi]|nr:helix-turn-helix domain-containing protein [Vibrio harveyi]
MTLDLSKLSKPNKGGRKKLLSDYHIKKLKKLREEGYTLDSLADVFKVSRTTITNYLAK